MPAFASEVIVITGAGSGLGRGMARRLADAGAAVAALDCNSESLLSLARELDGLRIATAVADVRDRAATHRAIRELEAALGPIDRLIASAGIGRPTRARQFSASEFADIIGVNLLGVANCVEAVLPGMIERRRGQIVALSSLASYRGLPLMSAYCASKSGLNAFFDSLAAELRQFNIAVTTICPGWVRTPLTEQVKFKMQGLLEPDAAVERILRAVRERKRFVAFPWRTALLLRVLRWLPAGVGDRLMAARLASGEFDDEIARPARRL